MNRVVITGIGIISCLGRGQNEVLEALLNARSGLELNQEYKDNGMRCHVSGKMKFSIDEIDRKMGRFMSETSAYSFVAAEEALKDSGLDNVDITNNETGVIVGSGTGSSREIKRVFEASKNGVKKIGPYSVTRTMGNTTSAVISTFFQTNGISIKWDFSVILSQMRRCSPALLSASSQTAGFRFSNRATSKFQFLETDENA